MTADATAFRRETEAAGDGRFAPGDAPQWEQLGGPERRRSPRPLRSAARTVVGALVRVVVLVPAAVVVSVLWACHRLVGFDPLEPPTGRRRWIERDRPDRHPERQYVHVRACGPRSVLWLVRRMAFRIVASVVLVVGGAALVVAVVRPLGLGPVDLAGNASAAVTVGSAYDVLGQDPHWAEAVTETMAFVRHARSDPHTTFSFADFDGRWVDVEDGVRETWRPPACGCRPLRVWVFGGSVAFGYFQKDDQTLPSQLAKAAWDDGVALEIENRAMPAFMLGQEARMFAHLLATEEPPDLAIFYDGANEVTQQNERVRFGEGWDDSEMVERTAAQRIDSIIRTGRADPTPHPSPDSPPNPGPFELGVLAGRRYERNRDLVRHLADAYGVPVVHFWQPIAATAPRELSARSVLPTGRDHWRLMYDGARSTLADGEVVDLTDALDDAPRPVFADIFHTNDLGARIVAERLNDELLPLFRRLSGS